MGSFGGVETYRAKKAEIALWQEDESPKVKTFTAQFLTKLDHRIASEQRTAEGRLELRKREYDTDGT